MDIKSNLTFRTILSACFLFLFSTLQIHAQEKNIYEITSNATSNERSHFYDLAFKLHTTIYLKNNKVNKTYGKGVLKKITLEDAKSLEILNNQDSKYKDVELITLTLASKNDLKKFIDLSNTNVFQKLKYIYIKSLFTAKPEDFVNFIKVNSNVRILYKSQTSQD